MTDQLKKPRKIQRESKLYEMLGVPIYGRPDESGVTRNLDSIDQDESKIRQIADHLQRRGYGVVRQRNPRAGKVFFTLKATWIGMGDPPENPFSGV